MSTTRSNPSTLALTVASIDSQLFVSEPDSKKLFVLPRKFTFRLMYKSMAA